MTADTQVCLFLLVEEGLVLYLQRVPVWTGTEAPETEETREPEYVVAGIRDHGRNISQFPRDVPSKISSYSQQPKSVGWQNGDMLLKAEVASVDHPNSQEI